MANLLKYLTREIRRPFNRSYAFKRMREYHSNPRSLNETVDWAINFGGGGGQDGLP